MSIVFSSKWSKTIWSTETHDQSNIPALLLVVGMVAGHKKGHAKSQVSIFIQLIELSGMFTPWNKDIPSYALSRKTVRVYPHALQ